MTIQLSRLVTSAEIDASKYKAGADQKVAADRAMVVSAQAAGQAVTATDTKISQSGDSLARLSRRYIEGQAAQLQFESGLGTIARGLDSGKLKMEQAQSILIGMNQKLGLSANASELAAKGQTQLAAAVSAANAQIQGQALAAEKTIASSKRMQAANANVSVASQLTAPSTFNTANIAAQFQDIGVTAAMGMSPLQIALQQGTQLQAVLGPLGAGGAVKALGGAFLSLINPVSLVTLALVGGTAAAIQYFMSSKKEVKTLDEALKVHEQSIARVSELWGEAAVARSKYGTTSTGSVAFGIEGDIAELQRQLKKAATVEMGLLGTSSPITDALKKSINDNLKATGLTEDQFQQTPLFKKIEQDWLSLSQNISEGGPAILKIIEGIETVGRTSSNSGLRAMAQDAATALQPFRNLAEALRDAAIERDRLFNNVGPNGMLLSRGTTNRADMGNLALFQSQEAVAAERRRQATEAQLQGMHARSPEERAAAARAAAAAQYNDESASARSDRIETAGKMALAEANHTLAEAQKDRARSLDQTLAGQQLDLTLIGKTAGETARLRMEFEQIAQVRAEAARNGIAADEAEIARIKDKAAAYGLVADEIARANLARDLQFERDQQFRSAQDQQIASRQQGAGLAVDLNSPAAQQMRDIARFADAKAMAVGFLTDFKAELISNGGDVGKALGASILNALTKSMNDQLGKLFDLFATWLASALTGQTPGGAGLGAAVAASAVGAFANDNYAPGAVTREPLAAAGGSALSMVGNYKAGVDPRLTDILNSAALQTPGYKVDAFSGYRPGDPRFHGRGLATDLTDLASGKSLGNYQDASSFRAYEEFAQNARKVQMAKYPELNDEFRWGGYFGGPKGKYGAMDQMHFDLGGGKVGMGGGSWAGGLNDNQRALFPGAESYGIGASANTATTALDKMSTNAITASQNLGALGGSVTSAVDALTGGIGGKGGLASILEGLKPGNFTPDPGGFAAMLGIGAGSPAPAAGGGGGLLSMLLGWLPKLFGFADGTENAPEGWAWVGERGPELRKLRGGDVIRSNGHSMNMAANANMSARGGGRGQEGRVELHVHINGANGDEHVRLLAKQGAQEAIGEYHESQAQGGIGQLQNRYAAQKG
ncbi:phage tail length tape measure family protein [Mesorhizobium sp. M0027]|uniref:phage tail length tape measure family protein n=1 Tax=Mesorhizobium sp. M0027 TaxID=2956848 RepID=UPI00333A733B